MGAGINLQGLAIDSVTPGLYLEIDFAVGQPAGVGTRRPILLIGNRTTAGTATADTVVYGPDTPVQCQTEQDVITLFGPGSELHRMFRRVTKIQQAVSTYLLAVTESAGAAATFTITFLTLPTVAGTVRAWIDDESTDVAFPANPANLGVVTAAVVAKVNSLTYWPCTAAQATVTTSNDSVTFTAKNRGPRGNWHRGMATIVLGNGAASTMTVTQGTDAAFSGGATADSSTTALATIASKRYYYIASSAEDATQFGALVTQVNAQAQPVVGIRQRAFAGSSDTLSNAITLATGINSPRAEVLWLQTSPVVPSELAAVAASVYAQRENSGSKPQCNFDGYGNDPGSEPWPVVPSRVAANAPSSISITSALNNGLTPVGVNPNNTTYLVKRITSKSLNGATNDYRIRDAHKVTVCDFFGDDLLAKFAAQFRQKNLSDDPKPGQPPPGFDTATPARVRDSLFGLITDYGEAPLGSNLLVNTDRIKAGSIVQRETPANRSRVSVLVPLEPVDVLDVIATLAQQVA